MWKFLIAIGLVFSLPNLGMASFDPKGSKCSFEDFMKKFIGKEKNAPKISSFLVADSIEHPENEYWVYWPQKREILLVGWPASDCSSPNLLIRRRVDLQKHIAKTSADVGASTYLVTEEWAMKAIFEASKNGYQISVLK